MGVIHANWRPRSCKPSVGNGRIFDSKPKISDNISHKLEQMENNNRMLKELATPDYPQLELPQSYKLKSGLIHLLPKFNGLAGENPHNHLKEFHVAVGDTGGLHQNEDVSFLPRWSSKGLAILTADSVQHVGEHEASNSQGCLVQSLPSQSISASRVLMAITKGPSIAIPRIYAIATSSVGRD
ncbi:hypothetical protein CR513_59233, partial [Mucuna pruriens]